MNEEEFDSLYPWQPFGTEDARRAEAKARRLSTLGIALWGSRNSDLKERLLAPVPDIPPGCDLARLYELNDSLEKLAALHDKRYGWWSSFSSLQSLTTPSIVIGTRTTTPLEARREIVRRAIRYLEGRL